MGNLANSTTRDDSMTAAEQQEEIQKNIKEMREGLENFKNRLGEEKTFKETEEGERVYLRIDELVEKRSVIRNKIQSLAGPSFANKIDELIRFSKSDVHELVQCPTEYIETMTQALTPEIRALIEEHTEYGKEIGKIQDETGPSVVKDFILGTVKMMVPMLMGVIDTDATKSSQVPDDSPISSEPMEILNGANFSENQ